MPNIIVNPPDVTNVNIVIGTTKGGESAYQLAVKNGFVGTEQQWLAYITEPAAQANLAAQEANLAAQSANAVVNEVGGIRDQIEALQEVLENLNLSQYTTDAELTQALSALNLSQYVTDAELTQALGNINLTNYVTTNALTTALNGLNLSQYTTDTELTQALGEAIASLGLSNYVTNEGLSQGLTSKVDRIGSEDIEITDETKGIIQKSPDGSKWRIVVDNSGVITSQLISSTQLDTVYTRFAENVSTDGGILEESYHSQLFYSLPRIVFDNSDVILIAGSHKEGVIYAMNPKVGAAIPLTFTRNSLAYEIDENGVLRYSQPNNPRLDRDTLTGAIKGYLREPAATNLLLRSNNLTSASWQKGSAGSGYQSPGIAAVITANYGMAPNGEMQATRLQLNRGTTGRSGVYQVRAATAGQYYTSSIYVKILDSTTIDQLIACENFGAFLGSTKLQRVRTAVPYKDGWYRITTTDTAVGSTSDSYRLQLIATDPIQTLDCLVWEAQMENNTLATSPIHTEADTVTRVADVIQELPTNNNSVFTITRGEKLVKNNLTTITIDKDTSVLSVLSKVLNPTEAGEATGIPIVSIASIRDTGFPLGMTTKRGTLSSVKSKEILETETVAFTLENDMKGLVTSMTTTNFANADDQVRYAKSKGLKIHGHAFIWLGKESKWVIDYVKAETTTVQMAKDCLKRIIQVPLLHFKNDPTLDGVITSWDVINEPFLDSGEITTTRKYKDDVFLNKIGEEFIALAFQYAYEADPRLKYFINDYDWQYGWRKLDTWIAKAMALKNAGVPIHGFGLQFHTDVRVTNSQMKIYLKQLGDTGMLIHLSEIAIMGLTTSGTFTPEQRALANEKHGNLARYALTEIPNGNLWGFKYWGINHGSYYLVIVKGLDDLPMLITDDFQRDSMYDAVLTAVKEVKGLT